MKKNSTALLDERLALAKKALLTRIARLENTKARVAPISLYGRRFVVFD